MDEKNKYLHLFWESATLWANYKITDKDQNARLAFINKWVTSPVRAVVDLGCGRGEILQSLPFPSTKIAVDISSVSLSYISDSKIIKINSDLADSELSKKVVDSAQNVDLTLCLEVLEHLTINKLSAVVSNILALSSKWIVVGVPYDEPLSMRSLRCPSCHDIVNLDTHFRRFPSKESVFALFSNEYELVAVEYIGTGFHRCPDIYYRFKNYILGLDSNNAVCYKCGKTINTHQSLFTGHLLLFQLIEKILRRIFVSKPYWMMLALKHKNNVYAK